MSKYTQLWKGIFISLAPGFSSFSRVFGEAVLFEPFQQLLPQLENR